MALVLDTSTSMEGDKLKQAKLACRSVAGMLRPQDMLWFAGYATQVTPLCDGLRGDAAQSACQEAIARLAATGVTRTDLALDWIGRSLPDESGTARVGIVVTDGHATDPRGEVLRDTSSIIGQARDLATSSVTLCSVGLGDASHFNTPFLVDLANAGRGEFMYAGTLDELEPRLRARFAASQSVSASDARLQIKVVRPGARIRNCCRLRPEYVPLDAPTSTGDVAISIGALRSDAPTDILIEVEVPQPPFGEPVGAHNVLEVSMIASGLNAPLSGVAAITDTKSYTEAQAFNAEVDRDRTLRDVAAYSEELSRTDDPNKTGDLLNRIADGAQKSGQLHLADDARRKLEELKRNGKLKPDSSTGLLDRAKKAGGGR
ncbi:MAG: VWA domain-containing protein [Armatimonadetes bacterium]|nr:VWA domain-containing protein [Armatimonadota bacterium]